MTTSVIIILGAASGMDAVYGKRFSGMIFVDPMSFEDWLRWREGGIGGSDAATIMGVSPWETPQELWARRTGRLGPKEDTFPMRRGRMLEPRARREYERRTGISMPKQLAMHDVHEWLRASLDGLNFEYRRWAEYKCPGRNDHGKACRGEIPEWYVWHMVHNTLVVGPEFTGDYFSFDPGSPTRRRAGSSALITFERNPELEGELLRKEIKFWWHVENDVPPPEEKPRKLPKVRAEVRSISERIFPVRRSK